MKVYWLQAMGDLVASFSGDDARAKAEAAAEVLHIDGARQVEVRNDRGSTVWTPGWRADDDQ